MIDTRLIGPKDDQYAVLSLGTVWLATTKKPYAEAVSAAIAAAIAGGNATDAAPSATAAISGDWPEDFPHENGEYMCQCVHCGGQFIGHKRRVTCKRCSVPVENKATAAPVEETAPDRPDWAQQLPGAEMWDRIETGAHGYDRTASLNAGHYVCTCGACSCPDASQPSPTTREQP